MPTTSTEIFKRWMDPHFKFFVNRKGSLQARVDFLLREERMKDEYLGTCLDYIRAGFLNGVTYKLSTTELVRFIQDWMRLNQGNLIWHDEPTPRDLRLPHIHYEACPRDEKHKDTLRDCEGKLRCAAKLEKRLKPSFVGFYKHFDELSMTEATECYDEEPNDPVPDSAWDEETGELDKHWRNKYAAYQEQLRKFATEEETFDATDICYAILSDESVILPLERVLNRLKIEPRTRVVHCGGNPFSPCKRIGELSEEVREMYELLGHCSGHTEENNYTTHPFNGWYLAWYIQKWYEQVPDAKAPVFDKRRDKDAFKAFPNFVPISSED